jgi:hypothetical protein
MGFFSGLAGALGGAGKALGGGGSAPTGGGGGGLMGTIANKVTAARSAQSGGGLVQEDRPSLLGTIAKSLAAGRSPIRVRKPSGRMSMTGRR